MKLIDMAVMAVFSALLSGVFYDMGKPGVCAAFGVISAFMFMASMIRYLNHGA